MEIGWLACGWQILGCLAGTTPQMVSAAVASLARLIYEFASTLCHTVPDLLPSALLLLRSKNREIIKVPHKIVVRALDGLFILLSAVFLPSYLTVNQVRTL